MNAIDIKYILYDIDASTEEKGVFRFLHKWNYTVEKFLSDWDRNGWYLYTTKERCIKFLNLIRR